MIGPVDLPTNNKMKLTKSQLKQIIKEEISTLMFESKKHPYTRKYVKTVQKIAPATEREYQNSLYSGHRSVERLPDGTYQKYIQVEKPATEEEYNSALYSGSRHIRQVYDSEEERIYWLKQDVPWLE